MSLYNMMVKCPAITSSCGGENVKMERSAVCGVGDISVDTHATVHGIVMSVSSRRKSGHLRVNRV